MKRVPLRRRSRLRAVSPKRASANRQYRILRAKFLTDNPWCTYPGGCGRRSQDVHHRKGRIGPLLLDVSHWSALCRLHHDWCGMFPVAAIAMGLSEKRLS